MKRELKTELTKQKIINAAIREFSRSGYEKSSINEICKSGINKGLIYHNFKNKDELYLICVKISCDGFLDLMDQKMEKVDMNRYFELREEYSCREESRIFFEALLNPPVHLEQEIRTVLKPFYEHREKVIKEVLSSFPLREGWTMEEACRYFALIIDGYNEFFSRKRMNNPELTSIVEKHENDVPKLIDLLLYGVVKRLQ
ncbi:DNA-binding HTH domain, TetR-type [Anaerobutyricum hallii]|uniref:DNA-binding HTH domain, TetR-type n=1 Tax=Anaerobutyricum hallii TaxID=39488 RepID=A0A285PTS1_9FIRM|nr:DNA-binding HTH domain, TetR-type [Anaerobutyricum hallii]